MMLEISQVNEIGKNSKIKTERQKKNKVEKGKQTQRIWWDEATPTEGKKLAISLRR